MVEEASDREMTPVVEERAGGVLLVYLEKPEVGVPEKTGRGRKPERPRVLNGVEPVRVREFAENPNLEWREVTVR
ncbi:MAG: hypothetical protein Q6352_008570 [Candidatus Freyrarchaeum guaymaensis]